MEKGACAWVWKPSVLRSSGNEALVIEICVIFRVDMKPVLTCE